MTNKRRWRRMKEEWRGKRIKRTNKRRKKRRRRSIRMY